MARGPALVQDVMPVLEEVLSDDIDSHAAARMRAMRERYAPFFERHGR
jgi:hypothetical protein